MASTALGTVPNAVIRMNSVSRLVFRASPSSARPLIPGMRTSVSTRLYSRRSISASAPRASFAASTT